MEVRKNHLGALDGLRVLATIAIFLYHAGILLQGTFPVTFFFMLSGFLLYVTKHELTEYPTFRAWLGYVRKKLKEFYPLHLATFLYACALIRPEWNGDTIRSAILNVTLLHAFSASDVLDFNALSWYLSAVMFLYLIGYFLLRFLNRYEKYRNYLIAATLALIGICNGLLWMNLPVYIYGNPIYRVLDFFLGMLAASIFLSRRQVPQETHASRKEIAICGAFVVGYVVSLWLKPKCGFYSALFAVALLVFAQGNGCISRLLSKNIFHIAAKCSFAFYMIHELVLRTLRQIIPAESMAHYPRIFLIAAIAFPITAALTWGEYRLKRRRSQNESRHCDHF